MSDRFFEKIADEPGTKSGIDIVRGLPEKNVSGGFDRLGQEMPKKDFIRFSDPSA